MSKKLRKLLGTGLVLVVAVGFGLWRYEAGRLVWPYAYPQATADRFRHHLPHPSAVGRIAIVESRGEANGSIREVLANRRVAVARQLIGWLQRATPVQGHQYNKPWANVEGVQIGFNNGTGGMFVQPAAYQRGSTLQLIPGVVSYFSSTGHQLFLRDAPLYHWITSHGWSKDLKRS